MAMTKKGLGDNFNLFGMIPGVIDGVVFDAAYPTGGYPVSGQLWGLAYTGGIANNGIRGIEFVGGNSASLLYTPFYNSQTGTIQVVTAGAEVANGTNLSAVAFDCVVYATGE